MHLHLQSPCAPHADASVPCRYVGASQARMTDGSHVHTYPRQDSEGRHSASGQPRQEGVDPGVSAGVMSGFSQAELVAMQALASLCTDTTMMPMSH